ncbi:phage baseplate protein [Acinetobacter proteolyticus]|uniref:phage baseplate protein n=1 Tax=Acinetobacter proteolyticus TaxID=1776741 RepID=UPI003D96A0CB
MALPLIPKPPFPNVPNLPGVPTLKRLNNQSTTVRAVLGKVQGEIWRALTTESNWGIFSESGELLVLADTVIDLSFKNSSKVAQHPVAEGAFASYNKVASPFETTVRLCKGSGLKTLGEIANVMQDGASAFGKGALNARSDFLDTIDELSKSLTLVHVVTPEKTYTSCNIAEYNYRREQSNGAHMLIVDISLVEVRQNKVAYTKSDAPTATENSKQPDAKPPVNAGKVQPKKVDDSVLNQIANKGLWNTIKGIVGR